MEWREGECSLRSWRDYCAGILSWRRTCHSKRVKGENPSLTCSQSSRGFAAKNLQLGAKSPDTQVKESVSLRSLLRADPFYFFSPRVTTL